VYPVVRPTFSTRIFSVAAIGSGCGKRPTLGKKLARTVLGSRISAMAQSSVLGCSEVSATNRVNAAIWSRCGLPSSSNPGWKMGLPIGRVFVLVRT
jgi:hypothetical protein